MSNMGGPINFLTHSNGYIFFFAGATAPPRDNVAPPLVLESDSQIVVNALCVLNQSPSSILKVVEGTMKELSCFDEWGFPHL